MKISDDKTRPVYGPVVLDRGLAPYAQPLSFLELNGNNGLMGSAFQVFRTPLSKNELTSFLRPTLADDGGISGNLPDCSLMTVSGIANDPGLDSELETNTPAHVFLVGECTSTFDVAWELHRLGVLPEWGAVCASSQSGGRGQYRRYWHSPPGNLYVSFRLPDKMSSTGDCAALVVGFLMLKALTALKFNFILKWPNDIVTMQHQKVGGILIEERNGVMMAGFGLNLVSAPLPSLLQLLDSKHGSYLPALSLSEQDNDGLLPPFWMWRQLVNYAFLEYHQILGHQSLPQIMSDILPHLALLGQEVKLVDNGKKIDSGVLQGLSPKGGLLIGPSLEKAREYFSGSLMG